MRVRLFRLGESSLGQIIRLDEFPATIIEDAAGRICAGDLYLERPFVGRLLFILDEQQGNLVLVDQEGKECLSVNEAPLEEGGLSPGDVLGVGDRRFMISYERITSHPLPPCRYRLQPTR